MPWRSNHKSTTFPTIFHLTTTHTPSLAPSRPAQIFQHAWTTKAFAHSDSLYEASNLAAERGQVYLSQMCRESMIRIPGKSERRQMTFKSVGKRYAFQRIPFGHFCKATKTPLVCLVEWFNTLHHARHGYLSYPHHSAKPSRSCPKPNQCHHFFIRDVVLFVSRILFSVAGALPTAVNCLGS